MRKRETGAMKSPVKPLAATCAGLRVHSLGRLTFTGGCAGWRAWTRTALTHQRRLCGVRSRAPERHCSGHKLGFEGVPKSSPKIDVT